MNRPLGYHLIVFSGLSTTLRHSHTPTVTIQSIAQKNMQAISYSGVHLFLQLNKMSTFRMPRGEFRVDELLLRAEDDR